MCKAIDGLIAAGEARGVLIGETRKQNEFFERISRLVREGVMSLAQAAACFEMSETEFKAKAGL